MNIYTHHIVYKTTNIVNDKIYIGVHSTNTLDDGYLGSGTELLRSIKKHGKEIFSREILFNFDTRQQAVDQEVELVTEAFVARADTYNLLPGGASSGSGGICSEETRQKISAANKNPSDETRQRMSAAAKNRKPFTEEHRQRMSKVRTGKTHSEETKRKMSAANKNPSDETRKKISEARKGKTHSEETRQKLSDAAKNQWARKKGVL
jgi:hypothetical protein